MSGVRSFAVFLFSATLALSSCASLQGDKVSPKARQDAVALFNQGKSYFTAVEKARGLDKPRANVGLGILNTQEWANLTQARMDLKEAAWTDPGAAWVPEALFLAARCYDYGFLQQFDRAIEEYEDVAARFPKSEFGVRAVERIRIIRSK